MLTLDSEERNMKKQLVVAVLFLLVIIMGTLASCTGGKDQYKLNIIYTSDSKGFLEDCG